MVSNLFSVIYFKGRDYALTNIDNDMQQSKTNKQSINLSEDSRTMGYETALEIYHSCVCACTCLCVNHAKNNAYAYRVDNEAAQNDDSSMPTWRKYNQKIYK